MRLYTENNRSSEIPRRCARRREERTPQTHDRQIPWDCDHWKSTLCRTRGDDTRWRGKWWNYLLSKIENCICFIIFCRPVNAPHNTYSAASMQTLRWLFLPNTSRQMAKSWIVWPATGFGCRSLNRIRRSWRQCRWLTRGCRCAINLFRATWPQTLPPWLHRIVFVYR